MSKATSTAEIGWFWYRISIVDKSFLLS